MQNTPTQRTEDGEPLYQDYWLVWTPWGSHTVSTVMAGVIERALTRWPRPAWVAVIDLAGGRLVLRTGTIMALEQSTSDGRAIWRRFRAERNAEDPERTLGL